MATDAAGYVARVTVRGVTDLVFHRFGPPEPPEPVYRNADRELCIPGEYLRMAIVTAARYRADPRRPAVSARSVYTTGLTCLTPLASLGVTEWDYLQRTQTLLNTHNVVRTRPAMRAGWTATFDLRCTRPDLIPPEALQAMIAEAGRTVGMADFRPTYGRFALTSFEV